MIRVRGLRKDYPGGPRALDGIDLHVARGEFVALIEGTAWHPIFLGEDGADVYAVLEKD